MQLGFFRKELGYPASLNMSLFDNSAPDLKLLLSLLRKGDKLDYLAAQQLQRELNDSVQSEACSNYIDGVQESLLFQKLPPEIRQHIWSYLVVVPESIHVYPVKRNVKQGFRLSRCGDACMNLTNGWCECNNDGLIQNPTPPAYLDTELLLVRHRLCFYGATDGTYRYPKPSGVKF